MVYDKLRSQVHDSFNPKIACATPQRGHAAAGHHSEWPFPAAPDSSAAHDESVG
jgi:hypothetical protein